MEIAVRYKKMQPVLRMEMSFPLHDEQTSLKCILSSPPLNKAEKTVAASAQRH